MKLVIQAVTKPEHYVAAAFIDSTLYWNLSNIDILTPEKPIGEGYVTFISDCGGWAARGAENGDGQDQYKKHR